MSLTLDEQINQLKQTIVDIESQRVILGDEAVEASLIPIRQKLADLEAKSKTTKEKRVVVSQRQRKLVTLLYMDVVGSTAMTQHLDPEDTLEIMDNALPRLAAPIEAHGGHVTRYTGDGFKAVFGDPIAREDDPEQAIRTGLEILVEAQSLARELKLERDIENFQVRMGIDTGLAALGGQTEAEDTVMGRVVNLAVRIESAAPPGGLLISHNTYRHVRGVFNVEPQDPITVKGFPEPIQVYLVKEIKPRAFRVQTRGVEGVETHMVGRSNELRFLQDALMTAFEEGEGHVVTISGEAGVGKSRLLYEFHNWLDLQPPSKAVRFYLGRGEQESQGLPYSLLRDLFAFRFQILDGDSGEQARQKIEKGLVVVFGDDEVAMMKAHIIGQLLGFDFSASPHLKSVLNDPQQLRNRGLIYLIQYFQGLSQEIPVVIFLEDIHWADDSSLDIVNQLGERTAELRILIVCAARLTLFERRPYWGEGQDYHTLLELHPLSKRESRNLVAEILKLAVDIPAELRELVVRGAEGNPFYTEELIKMLIEDDVIIPDEEVWRIDLSRLEQVDVPSTLAGVLQARLDSLPDYERTVLQQASIVGRLFWDRIVSYIQTEGGYGGDPALIPQTLTSLRNRELVFRHEESAFVGTVEYLFKHDVLREVTYESVLKRLRKIYHGLTADWLIKNSGVRIGEFSSLIGEHLLKGGRNEQACNYFTQAGESALASFANSEAEDNFRKALEVSPPEAMRAEILSGLGEALRLQGLNEEAEKFFRMAIQLYLQSGNSDRMGDTYTRLSKAIWETDENMAWKVCQEGLELMESAPDSLGYARLLVEGGRTALFGSKGEQVIPLCERAIEMARRVGDLEVQAEARVNLAIFMDDENKAIRILEEVITLAESKGMMSTADRAHHNLAGTMGVFYIDIDSTLKHLWRAAEIQKQIGNIEGMMTSLSIIYRYYYFLGELNTIEESVAKFLGSSTATRKRIEEFLVVYRPDLMEARGEWFLALEMNRKVLKDFQDGGNLSIIGYIKYRIARNILELNRFGYEIDLSEAESGLLENIEQNTNSWKSRLLLVQVDLRRGLLRDAQDLFDQEKKLLAQAVYWKIDTRNIRSVIEFEILFLEEHWDEAILVCQSLIESCRSGGYRWPLARRLIDLGDALAGRNEGGDLDRAREAYQESLDMFTEMGAPGYIKVLEERLREL